jgi:hypothetical protein
MGMKLAVGHLLLREDDPDKIRQRRDRNFPILL